MSLTSWKIPENQVTSETVYDNRRRFLQGLLGAGLY
jgi:sulfoxide reductase catalytic subunit YedY